MAGRFIRFFVSCLTLLPPLVRALALGVSEGIQLRAAPLIGGPSWLPLHVKVVIDDTHTVDFVPLNPTSKSTLTRLLTLQCVPAQARFVSSMQSNNKQENQAVQKARIFCENYSKDLNLITNNCWTFAYELVIIILQKEVKKV